MTSVTQSADTDWRSPLFQITVWHTTPEAEKLGEDESLIEAALRIWGSFDSRYL
jgi:hypothetical protein